MKVEINGVTLEMKYSHNNNDLSTFDCFWPFLAYYKCVSDEKVKQECNVKIINKTIDRIVVNDAMAHNLPLKPHHGPETFNVQFSFYTLIFKVAGEYFNLVEVASSS